MYIDINHKKLLREKVIRAPGVTYTTKENKYIYFELPVKLIPARSGELVMTSPNKGPSHGINCITPAQK